MPPTLTISKQTPSFVTPASFAVTAHLWETPSMLSAPTVTAGNEPRRALKFNKKINEWGVPGDKMTERSSCWCLEVEG